MYELDARFARDSWVIVNAEFWGAHAPSRVDFGASPKSFWERVCDREGAIASTRGGCAPQT